MAGVKKTDSNGQTKQIEHDWKLYKAKLNQRVSKARQHVISRVTKRAGVENEHEFKGNTKGIRNLSAGEVINNLSESINNKALQFMQSIDSNNTSPHNNSTSPHNNGGGEVNNKTHDTTTQDMIHHDTIDCINDSPNCIDGKSNCTNGTGNCTNGTAALAAGHRYRSGSGLGSGSSGSDSGGGSPYGVTIHGALQGVDLVEETSIALAQGIKDGSIDGSSMHTGPRRVVVKMLKEQGLTQDAIAEFIGVTRRTIVNDYKALREEAALAVKEDMTQLNAAGQVRELMETCINQALKKKQPKYAMEIMKEGIELLQSLGILPTVPKLQKSLNLTAHAHMKQSNYSNYMDKIGSNSKEFADVLNQLIASVE